MEQKHSDAVIRHNSGAQLSKMKSQLKIFNNFSSTFEVSSSVVAKKIKLCDETTPGKEDQEFQKLIRIRGLRNK